MAVHLATGSDYLQRTTGLIPASSDRTFMVWAKTATTVTGTDYQTYLASINLTPATYTAAGAIYQGVDIGAQDFVDVNNGVTDMTTTKSNALANQYTHFCWTYNATSHAHQYYRNGTLIGSFSLNFNAVVLTYDLLGSDSGGLGNVTIAQCKQWNTVLTQDQILTEMQSVAAVTTANLWLNTPLTSDLLDVSGNGRNWTQTGSGTFVAGPTFPSNSSAATATAITTLPQTISEAFGDGVIAWYRVVGQSEQANFGFWAFSNLTDQLDVKTYTGPVDALQLQITGAINVPIQPPTSVGESVYVRVYSGANPPTADVAISILPGPHAATPRGAIFVNDDTLGPTAIVSPTDGANYSVLAFRDIVVTTSEDGGDVLDNGRVLLVDDETSTVRLFDGQLDYITTVSGIATVTSTHVRTCKDAQVFYVGNPGGGLVHAVIYRVDANGAVTDSWTLTSAGLTGAAASNDETIIYVTGQTSATNAPIKQWNPNTNTFGADLVAGVPNYATGSLMVLGDNTILALYTRSAVNDLFVRRYNAAGATLNTYSFPTAVSDSSIFSALDDPTSFWLRTHNRVSPHSNSNLYNIRTSDGTVLATINQQQFQAGVYDGAATATPTARFGLSLSCPSFILREAIIPTPAVTSNEYLIRRERWFPHLSQEQFRQFFLMLQIDLYAGNGITTGQGSDPLMEVDWSDDGGHTWSSIHFVNTGKLGEFTRRAILRRMGYGRDRVFRIAVTDPVQWSIISGYLQAVLGTS